MTKIRAKVIEKGDLAVIITELGQKAVIPIDKLCELASRFNIEYTNIKIDCQKLAGGEHYIEIE